MLGGDFSRDSLLVTSRGVSGGVSGITGYQPTFFESKQLIKCALTPKKYPSMDLPSRLM
jgi:hypothetical protein